MDDLFAAIITHYTTDPLAASDLTDLYNTQAPQDAVFPYVVFALISDVPEWTFSEDFENCLIQFNIFSDKSNPVEICALYELLKGDVALGTGFDFLDLPVTDYEIVSLIRENAILTRLESVWQYNVTYRMEMQKTDAPARALTVGMYNLLGLL